MARAQDKQSLIESANQKFLDLVELIKLDDSILLADFKFETKKTEAHWKRDKNIRDVLYHVYRWHHLLLNWVISNINDEKVPFLPSPYNWKNYAKMNEEFFAECQNIPLEEVVLLFSESHGDVMNIIYRFSDNELFNKGVFPWTGTTTLASYCISATASHYDWASKKIKLHIKSFK